MITSISDMNLTDDFLLTVVTATLNVEDTLPRLIGSLRNQSDKKFRWIIADGGSSDRTIEIVKNGRDVVSMILTGPDFGIYHGLNRAIVEVRTPYYLVVGADDLLEPNAISHIKKAIRIKPTDFVSGHVRTSSGEELRPARGSAFRYGHLAYVSQHSVGTAISTKLHDRVGKYSNQYPIAADRAFILTSIEVFGATVSVDLNYWGTYATTGVSNSRYVDTLLDICKVDIRIRRKPILSILKLIVAMIVNFRKFR